MGTIAQEFNTMLAAFFNKDDLVYQSVFCNEYNTPETSPVNPEDMNIGAVASMIEYNRRLSLSLIKQLFLDQAEGIYLNLIAQNYLDIARAQSESDADYRARIVELILGHKVSPAAIIYTMRKYSSQEPEIYEGKQNSAYASLSYAGVYSNFKITSGLPHLIDTFVFPAVTLLIEDEAFKFILFLWDTASGDIPLVIDTLNQFIAAGVTYEVRIQYA